MKQRNLERRWKICMKVVGGKCLDDESSNEIRQIKLTVGGFEKELERNLEFKDKFAQADCSKGINLPISICHGVIPCQCSRLSFTLSAKPSV